MAADWDLSACPSLLGYGRCDCPCPPRPVSGASWPGAGWKGVRWSRCGQQDLASSPGPVVLYRCAAYEVAAIPLDRIQAVRADDRDVQLDAGLSGPGWSAAAIYEHLRIGTARPAVGSAASGLVITSVSAI